MIAYKLFRVRKDGSLGSLFINRKARIPMLRWLEAEGYPTKGYTYRPFWHCTSRPIAPHLTEKDRAWYVVAIEDDAEVMPRPESQGGKWYLAKKMIVLDKL